MSEFSPDSLLQKKTAHDILSVEKAIASQTDEKRNITESVYLVQAAHLFQGIEHHVILEL